MRLFLLLSVALATATFSFGQTTQMSELDEINHKIESLRTKRDITKADPVENQKALDEGWYETNSKALKVLFDKKREIIKEQTGKTFISYEEIETYPSDKKQILLSSNNHIIEQK